METLSPPSDHRRPPGHRMDHHPDDPDPRIELSAGDLHHHRYLFYADRLAIEIEK